MMCPKCGGLIGEPNTVYGWAGKWCYCGADRQQNTHTHCYCKEVLIDGKPHYECCMCGQRNLKFGINGSTTTSWLNKKL